MKLSAVIAAAFAAVSAVPLVQEVPTGQPSSALSSRDLEPDGHLVERAGKYATIALGKGESFAYANVIFHALEISYHTARPIVSAGTPSAQDLKNLIDRVAGGIVSRAVPHNGQTFQEITQQGNRLIIKVLAYGKDQGGFNNLINRAGWVEILLEAYEAMYEKALNNIIFDLATTQANNAGIQVNLEMILGRET